MYWIRSLTLESSSIETSLPVAIRVPLVRGQWVFAVYASIHSPILMAYPNADILEFSEIGTAGYVIDVNSQAWQTEFASDEEFAQWLDTALAKSTFTGTITPTTQDRILSFSTCTYEYDNARFVLVGVLSSCAVPYEDLSAISVCTNRGFRHGLHPAARKINRNQFLKGRVQVSLFCFPTKGDDTTVTALFVCLYPVFYCFLCRFFVRKTGSRCFFRSFVVTEGLFIFGYTGNVREYVV